jgi:hypothetical protein
MIGAIITEMGALFRKGVFDESTSFRFILDDTVITVTVDADSYMVERGAASAKADCSCKTSAEMFRKIWYEGYKPGIMEFLCGEIECDAPLMLPQFLKAFGKQ